MSNDLPQPSDRLFQEIRQFIDAAKQRAAVAINGELSKIAVFAVKLLLLVA
jgi:hypothetical protein